MYLDIQFISVKYFWLPMNHLELINQNYVFVADRMIYQFDSDTHNFKIFLEHSVDDDHEIIKWCESEFGRDALQSLEKKGSIYLNWYFNKDMNWFWNVNSKAQPFIAFRYEHHAMIFKLKWL